MLTHSDVSQHKHSFMLMMGFPALILLTAVERIHLVQALGLNSSVSFYHEP